MKRGRKIASVDEIVGQGEGRCFFYFSPDIFDYIYRFPRCCTVTLLPYTGIEALQLRSRLWGQVRTGQEVNRFHSSSLPNTVAAIDDAERPFIYLLFL